MQTIKAKRKKYAPDDYAVLIRELNVAMTEVPKLTPNRDTWDIEGDWLGTGVIHFVDARYQNRFDTFADFDCRTIKLANHGKPATRISFFQKFIYWVLKETNLNQEEKERWINTEIDAEYIDLQILSDKCETNHYTGAKLSEMRGEIGQRYQGIKDWQHVLDNLDGFEIAVSNYARRRQYCTMNYKYLQRDLTYANTEVHMLNPQKDRLGFVSQLRYNIIFIDMEEITRPHPHQHKEIDKFLNSFGLSTNPKRQQQIYAKPKRSLPNVEQISEYEPAIEVITSLGQNSDEGPTNPCISIV